MGFPRFITTKCCKCGKKFGIPETIWATQIIQCGKKFICNDCRDKGKFESNYINTCDVEDLQRLESHLRISDRSKNVQSEQKHSHKWENMKTRSNKKDAGGN